MFPQHPGLAVGVGTHNYPPVSSLPFVPPDRLQWLARSTMPTLIEYSS